MPHPYPSFFTSLVLACVCTPAVAATDWLCALSHDGVRLVCVADTDPTATLQVDSSVTASVRGTAFPLDRQQVYAVDLWSPPTEPDWVLLLARSTICFRSPDCTVTVAPSAWTSRSAGMLRTAQAR